MQREAREVQPKEERAQGVGGRGTRLTRVFSRPLEFCSGATVTHCLHDRIVEINKSLNFQAVLRYRQSIEVVYVD